LISAPVPALNRGWRARASARREIERAQGPGPAECKQVHFSNVGRSCITATTAIATAMLDGLGYGTKVGLLSVPVSFKGLSTGDPDAFLRLWLPTRQSMIGSHIAIMEGGRIVQYGEPEADPDDAARRAPSDEAAGRGDG